MSDDEDFDEFVNKAAAKKEHPTHFKNGAYTGEQWWKLRGRKRVLDEVEKAWKDADWEALDTEPIDDATYRALRIQIFERMITKWEKSK